MHPVRDEDDLQQIKAQGRGFLVNVWPGKQATVHPVAYLCWNAREQMRASSRTYTTFFAETREELNNHLWGPEELKDCPLCEQERRRRQ